MRANIADGRAEGRRAATLSVHIDSWRVAKMLLTLADKMRELSVVTTRDDKINILARRRAQRNSLRKT